MEKHTDYQYLFDVDTPPVETILKKLSIDAKALEGKTVLLTGGARGIGKEVARGLGYLGANVAIVDKRASGQTVADNIVANGGQAIFIHKDISESANIRDAFELIKKEYGPVNILINNAVHFTIASFEEMSAEEWDLTFRTNIGAMMHTTKMALPDMRASGNGTIINVLGPEGMAYAAAMSSSKVAMRSLLFSLSNEIPSDEGIHIVGFAPGFVATPLVADVFVSYCQRVGIDFEEYVHTTSRNPGYEGLMPAEHCAAGLIHTIINANDYHGLIADAYVPLSHHGIIELSQDEISAQAAISTFNNTNTISRYISEITTLNNTIESKIKERTRKITKEKEMVTGLLKEIQNKNRQLESIKDELLTAKNRAEAASVHKEEFLTNVTHEIRTPLNAIIGFIDLLKDSPLSNEQREHINAVQISGEKLLKLINEVLDIAKIEAGKLELEPEIFNLHTFLEDLEKSTMARAGTKGNQLHSQVSPDIPKLVKGDPNRLHQVLINLLGNAIKFTDEGLVEIHCDLVSQEDSNCHVCFKIIDNGIGISTDNQQSIFETFTQVKGQRNRQHGGSGLGLAIVKKLVDLMKGKVSLHSEAGVGSTFTVTIPLKLVDEKQLPGDQLTIIENNCLEGLDILLAEDNQFNQILETKILTNLGARVTLAENGREAIEHLQKSTFDIILMDVQMPEMDGLEATKFIVNTLKLDTPIIALTANAFKQDLDKCLEVGMRNYVTKPFKKEVLAQQILEYTAQPMDQ